jgi:hypothetical protein
VTDEDWRLQVASLRAAAEAELQAAIRGESLCDIARRGEPGPAYAKYAEGKWVAFRDIERCDDRATAIAELEGLLKLEQEHMNQHLQKARGSDWIEYSRGRVDAFGELRELLLTTPS